MSNYTYYVLLVLLFLAIAIYNMYRLKKSETNYVIIMIRKRNIEK